MLRGVVKRAAKVSGTRRRSIRQMTSKVIKVSEDVPVKLRVKRHLTTTATVSDSPLKRKKLVELPPKETEPEKKSTRKKKEQTAFQPADDRVRCHWCQGSAAYVQYHDTEWGVPVHGDQKLFEFLTLEGAQAGLSWITILNKREDYRTAFHNFDMNLCAVMTDRELENVLAKSNVVKHRLKIWSVRSNALCALNVKKEFGSLAKYLWGFVKSPSAHEVDTIRATSPESEAMSKDMKKRGFRFVGPTIMYAFMQAIGMVNDHTSTCFRRTLPKS